MISNTGIQSAWSWEPMKVGLSDSITTYFNLKLSHNNMIQTLPRRIKTLLRGIQILPTQNQTLPERI